MRGIWFSMVAAAMLSVGLGFGGPALAAYDTADCAEGADEDLVTVESETTQPTTPILKPTS